MKLLQPQLVNTAAHYTLDTRARAAGRMSGEAAGGIIGTQSRTRNHHEEGVCSLQVGVRADISIAHRGEAGGGPVHGRPILHPLGLQLMRAKRMCESA
jgi:hypothetical protein